VEPPNVSISTTGEVSGRRRGGRGGGRVAGATGRESSRKAKVYMRSPRVLTLSISRTCRFQIGIHISRQISRFTYPSGSVSFLNLALPSAPARAQVFPPLIRSGPARPLSLFRSRFLSRRLGLVVSPWLRLLYLASGARIADLRGNDPLAGYHDLSRN